MISDNSSLLDSIAEMTDNLAPNHITNLKRMVELGKKPDGKPLSKDEISNCISLVTMWEKKHLPKEKRSGFIQQQCKNTQKTDTQPLNLTRH